MPDQLIEALLDENPKRSASAMRAMMQMTKLDIGALEKARAAA